MRSQNNTVRYLSLEETQASDRVDNDTLLKKESSIFNVKKAVRQMANINLIGHTIPHAWYQHVVLPNGAPDPIAIILLSDIVYWYRPEVQEKNGSLWYKKRFKADQLQRSIGYFVANFGFSKRQVSDALSRLEEQGIIVRELRTIMRSHCKIPNVLYIAINADKIAEISQLKAKFLPDHDERNDNDFFNDEMLEDDNAQRYEDDDFSDFYTAEKPKNSVPAPISVSPTKSAVRTTLNANRSYAKGATYTKNTTKISTKNTAAEATGGFEAPLKAQHIAAAAANHSQQNNTTPVGNPDTPQTPNVSCVTLSVAELRIGDALTESQKAHLAKRLSTLSLDAITTQRLAAEIEAGLLDPQCFIKSGNDYHRKLNAIFKTLQQGQWTPPASFASPDEAQKARVLSEEQKALNAALREYDRHYNSYLNLNSKRNALTQNDTKATWNYVILMVKNEWQKLRSTYDTIRQSFPAATIAPIPAVPADFLEAAHA